MNKLIFTLFISLFSAGCYTVVTPPLEADREESPESSDTYVSGDYVNIYAYDNDFWWGRYSHHPRYRRYYWWTDFYYDPYYYDYNYFYDDYYWYWGGLYDYPYSQGHYWGYYGNSNGPVKKQQREINYDPRPGRGGRGTSAGNDSGGGNSSVSQPTAVRPANPGNHSGSQNEDHKPGGNKPHKQGKKISKKPGRRPR